MKTFAGTAKEQLSGKPILGVPVIVWINEVSRLDTVTDANGNYRITDELPPGNYNAEAQVSTTSIYATCTSIIVPFMVDTPTSTPAISVSPSYGPAGTAIIISGTGWGSSYNPVNIYIQQTPDILSRITGMMPNSNGLFSLPYTIHVDYPTGPLIFVARSYDMSKIASATFTVL